MRSCTMFFRRASSLIVLLTVGVCLSSQEASADSFNWQGVNGLNWNSTVKSQFGGTCWDFAAVGSFEAKYKLTRNDASFNPDLSEEQLCWETNPDLGGTGGGSGVTAMAYCVSHGVVSESECPYQSSSPDTGIAPYWPLASGWQNRCWISTTGSSPFVTSTTDGIKAAIKLQGPLLTGILSTNDLYDSVANLEANYRGPASGVDHAVDIVGYQDDANVPSGGYWIIKNSWDVGWGQSGYGFIPYGDVENHSSTQAYSSPVYYTGAMLAGTWTGSGSGGAIWTASSNTKYYNFSGMSGWVNQETAATFDSSSSNRTISVVNTVIAHQLTFGALSSGSNYTLNNGGSGALTVTAGGIQTNQSATINVPVTIGAPQTWTTASGMTLNVSGALHTIISDLTISGAGSTIIGGPIDGGGVLNTVGGAAAGNLNKSGTGTLTLSGASNYSGNITVSAGVLSLAPASGATATYSGAISGSGAVQKNDLGTVVLSGSTTGLSGAVTVNQGQLTLNNVLALGTSSNPVTIGGGQVNLNVAGGTVSKPVTINNGGILNQLAANGVYGGTINCTGAAEIRCSGGALTLSNTISGNMGGNGLTFNGVGGNTITLTGNLNETNSSGVTFYNGTTVLSGSANTYNGATTIANGTLKPTKATNLPSATNVTLNAGTLNLNGYSQSIASVTSLVPASDLVTSAGSCTLTVTPTADTTYAGQFSGPINLTKSGSKTFILSGNNALNASVTTTINGGTLQIGNGGTTGTLQGNIANNGTLAFSRSDDVSFGGNISGASGSVVKQGTNTLVLTGANSYGGGTTINGGTLQIGSGGTTGSIAGAVTVNSGTLAFARSDDTSFSGAIGGAGGVLKYCASRLTLSGPNSYSGPTVVAGGTLELAPSAQSCVLNGGGIDLQAGKVVFDYASGADPIATIQGLLGASYHNGQWDVGQFRDSTASASGLTLGVLDNASAKTVTIMATYPGDFNLDGVVDNLDRQVWFANAFSGTTWQQGDANRDGVVDGLDRDMLFSNAGATAPVTSMMPAAPASMDAASGTAAPEPGTLALLAAGLVGLLAYGWRKGKRE